MKNKLPNWPFFDKKQIKEVTNVLESGRINYLTGNQGELFEKKFSDLIKVKYSIAMSNGSVALSACYASLGIGIGDEVITTSRTFIATSSTIVLCGATPIFADVDPESGCITSETIEPLINNRTKAIAVVHFAGWPADMESICRLAKKHNIYVIEDCAQAHGAEILVDERYRSVGTFGDVSAWSFCQDKIISTGGEGGMITTNNPEIKKFIWSFKDHGKNFDLYKSPNSNFTFKWVHENFGNNFRMTEMQSVIGIKQLELLNNWTKIRTNNARIIREKLEDLNAISIPIPSKKYKHAWYKFYCYIEKDAFKEGWSRDRIIQEIRGNDYPAFSGGCSEIYLEKCFQNSGIFPKERLKVARNLGESSLMFLVHPTINESQMYTYAEVVKEIIKQSLR